MNDSELDRFKTEVNLSEFAAWCGYQLVTRERSANGRWRGSTKASLVMRHPGSDDKIIISRGSDLHWTYFSVRDDRDNGSVVDFIQKRQRVNLGGVRIQLRKWLGVDRPSISPTLYEPSVEVQVRDLGRVKEAFLRSRPVENSAYLNRRGIRPETLGEERFAGSFRANDRGTVLFPHYDFNGSGYVLVGFEQRNHDFTSFSKGGNKRLWLSHPQIGDDSLVFAESAIDALSYHQINRLPNARYASTAGAIGPAARDLIRRVIGEMPPGSTVVVATDNDQGGHKLASQIEAAAAATPVRRHQSPVGKDWNDYLKDQERAYILSIDLGPGTRPLQGGKTSWGIA